MRPSRALVTWWALLFSFALGGHANATETPSIVEMTGSFRPGPYSSIAVDPKHTEIVAIGTSDGHVLLSRDGGVSSSETHVLHKRDFLGPNNRPFGAIEHGNIYSRRFMRLYNDDKPPAHWESFIAADFVLPIEINALSTPGPDGRALVSSGSGIYLSDMRDGAYTQVIGIRRPFGKGWTVGHAIARDPGKPEVVLAATSDGLFLSQNGGFNFAHHPDSSIKEEIKQILWDQKNPENVYIASAQQIFRSTDRGQSFSSMQKTDDDVNALSLSAGCLWVATGGGVSCVSLKDSGDAKKEEGAEDEPLLKEESVAGVLPLSDNSALAVTDEALYFVKKGEDEHILLRTGYNDPFLALVGDGHGTAWALTQRGVFRIGAPLAREKAIRVPKMVSTFIEVERAVATRFHITQPADTRIDRPGDRRAEERDHSYTREQPASRWYARILPRIDLQISNGWAQTSNILYDYTFPIRYRTASSTNSSSWGGAFSDEPGFVALATWNLSEMVFGEYSNVSDPLQFNDADLRDMRKQLLEETRHQYRQCAHLVQLLSHPPTNEALAFQWELRMQEHASYLEAMSGRRIVEY